MDWTIVRRATAAVRYSTVDGFSSLKARNAIADAAATSAAISRMRFLDGLRVSVSGSTKPPPDRDCECATASAHP
jgi:hypothetical protein